MPQVLSFLDATSNSLLKLMRGLVTLKPASKGKQKEKVQSEDIDTDDEEPNNSSAAPNHTTTTIECGTIVNNLADLFQHYGLRDQPDIVAASIETIAHVTRHCTAGEAS